MLRSYLTLEQNQLHLTLDLCSLGLAFVLDTLNKTVHVKKDGGSVVTTKHDSAFFTQNKITTQGFTVGFVLV